jgi:hypothetical protein
MNYFTKETYSAKREIVTFSKKLSDGFSRPHAKFVTDMMYGMIASGSIVLSDIADSLKEGIHKDNTIERLSLHLKAEMPRGMYENYIKAIRSEIPDEPIVLFDDSDVVKPHGKKFEAIGYVKDGSEPGTQIKRGYRVTEAAVLSKANQPISLFSHIHSEREKHFLSTNTYTFEGMDTAIAALLGRKATFILDRGYDSNKVFKHLYDKEQFFVIRLTQNRKLYYKGKWLSAPTLCGSRKGKFKTVLKFQGVNKECYISVIHTQITESKRPLRLVLVYGLSDTPMMLVTNRAIAGKDDAIGIVRMYLSRWRIEEYFRFKKQHFGFENFRVRNLKAINNLNTLLSYAISYIALLSGKDDFHGTKAAAIRAAAPIREKVLFFYYRIAKGLASILAHARVGIKDWYKPELHVKNRQLCFKLVC